MDNVFEILSQKGLNALIFSDPYAKLCCTAALVRHCCLHAQKRDRIRTPDPVKRVVYIDLDTTFSAFVKGGLILRELIFVPKIENKNIFTIQTMEDIRKNLLIYIPVMGSFESILSHVIDSMSESALVIVDSLNSFFNLYYDKIKIETGYGLSSVNHLLSAFIMLLVRFGWDSHVPILVTSMLRYKKKVSWIHIPASNRLLRRKSIVTLFVEMINESDLSLRITDHPSRPKETLIFNDYGIRL